MANDLAVIKGEIDSVADRWNAVRVDKSLNFQAEAGFASQVLAANDYALGIAMKNKASVVNAVMNIAAIGISLNPARRQAYLVPRDGRICLDISYIGLMDLAMQSGAIQWAQCALVYEKDEFALDGLDKQPRHQFNPFAADRGALVGVYAVVKTAGGDYLTHTMSIADVYAIRDRSAAWKSWIQNKRTCPWVTSEGEMVRKTCIKQAFKYWPRGERSSQLEAAVQYLNTEAGEGFAQEPTPTNLSIPATHGAMERLGTDEQVALREMAAQAVDFFENDSPARALDYLMSLNLDADQTTAIWTLFSSEMRSGIKKERAERAEAAAALAGGGK